MEKSDSRQKEYEKAKQIIEMFLDDDYIDDKMMNDWLEGDDDWEYDFLWYKSVATPQEESLRVQENADIHQNPLA